MLLLLAIVLIVFMGNTPLGWFGGVFLAGVWLGLKANFERNEDS